MTTNTEGMTPPAGWVDEVIRQIMGGHRERRQACRRVMRCTAVTARVVAAVASVLVLAVCVAAWRGWWQPGHGLQAAAAVVSVSAIAVHQAAHVVLRRTGRDGR